MAAEKSGGTTDRVITDSRCNGACYSEARLYFTIVTILVPHIACSQVDEAEANERDDLEAERDEKLVQLKERLESEVTTATDDMEKKHAYRLEQARQRLTDEHDKVCCQNYYYKCSLITINLINSIIYLPKGREFKKMKTYYTVYD